MTAWTVKKRFDVPSELVPHINWESCAPYADIYGRLVIEKDFKTGAVTVEVQAPAEDASAAALFPPCDCIQCQTIRAKEAQRGG